MPKGPKATQVAQAAQPKVVDPAEEEKKRKRAERFGPVATPAAAAEEVRGSL